MNNSRSGIPGVASDYTLRYNRTTRQRAVYVVVLAVIHQLSFGQIGVWQSHASYGSGQSIAVTPATVYAATQNGLFYVDKATNELTTLSKRDGLSDVGISRLLYLADQKRLLIAYRSGNLDFLSLSDSGEPAGVLNVNTILVASNLPASRTINHIYRSGNNAYLSTDFGLVVVDVVKNEIRDTYFSQRADGSVRPIYQTTATADSLYALTAPPGDAETGRRLRAIRFAANVNIADPANWKSVTEPGAELESIVTNQGRLSVTVNGQGVYERQVNRWVRTQTLANTIIRQFPTSTTPILATNGAVTSPAAGTLTSSLVVDPREVALDGTSVWIADTQNGLLTGRSGAVLQRIAPEGPAKDQFTSLYTYAQRLVGLPAVILATNQPSVEVFSVADQRWLAGSGNSLTRGFSSAAYLPTEQKLYLGNAESGLWVLNNDQTLSAITLPTSIGSLVNTLATDAEGNVWIAAYGSANQQTALHVRRPDGQFQSFPTVGNPTIVQIVVDDNGFLWMRLNSAGILVFDPQTNRSRYLTTASGQGGLLSSIVRTLVKDRNGAIWVGTDNGPTVFDDPAGAFDARIDAQPPVLNRRRLLANEPVTAIAVDGGNRKWIGTRDGLYLVAPDGSQLLETFTADNSPLPASYIQALAIEPTSGVVFIETGAPDRPTGLVSYRGAATEPASALSSLTIFPNPVRPDFTGTVGINGLTENSTVKILDSGGQLVYETRSQGGTAAWNLRDYRGRAAQTGIYLVVVVTTDGAESLAGKLAVVR